jgi:hypothetical protein
MQISNPAYSLNFIQSLNLNRLGMHRQRGVAFTVFRSVERTQTSCQQEERFTVQNKIADASPHLRSAPKNKSTHSTQIPICHEERSALQNKKSAGAIEPALRFDGHRENLMNQSGKTHPKSETLIRHKPLYAIENSPEYKTRRLMPDSGVMALRVVVCIRPKLTSSASKGRASQKSRCWSNSKICMWLCWSGDSLVRPLLALRVSLAGKDHPGIRYEPTRIRAGAKAELIAAKPLITSRYIQITKQGLIKNASFVLTRTLPVWAESLDRHHATFFKSYERSQTFYQKEERFTVQNKMTNADSHPRTVSKRTTFSLRLTCHSSKRR